MILPLIVRVYIVSTVHRDVSCVIFLFAEECLFSKLIEPCNDCNVEKISVIIINCHVINICHLPLLNSGRVP